MCGIAGIVSTSRPDPELVRRMCGAITHRGPDGAGFHSDEHAALGMQRLAIIDVASGDQPVYSEDGRIVAVFNGEIYNFAELRRELVAKGHILRSEGDSECLVHLYEEFGVDLVHRLRGMFAFAIWDRDRRRLVLARDRVGKKPLYWRSDHSSIRFASELKALATDPDMSREVNPVALHHYLTYLYVPAPWSIYQGTYKLSPGHVLTWEDGRVTVSPYWRFDSTPRHVADEQSEEERLRELLLEATRIRMVSERPIGAFLSGGIDSSAVVAAMAMQHGEPVRTFSIGFTDKRYDERHWARLVAQRYGTEHRELVITPDLLDILPKITWHFDEPFADSSAIPSFYVAWLSRQHVTVALNGDGGDECFGGYNRYTLAAGSGRIPVLPRALAGIPLRVGGFFAEKGAPGTVTRRLGRVLQFTAEPPARRYALMMSAFTGEGKHALYGDEFRTQLAGVDSYNLLEEAYRESRADTDLGRLMDVDVNSYLPGDLLVKVDISTMANSLEARSPFLDHHLMEWAAGLPLQLKVHEGQTKRLLKRAVAPWLPQELMNRPKQGFGVPLAMWLRRELRDLAFDMLTDHTARGRGMFRPSAVRGLLQRHQRGADHSVQLWALLQFELWHRAHAVPGAQSPSEVRCSAAQM
ncbi:asparagine synthase (glutamine-hydrolyzing) [Planotetraspora kaengkrachanensis]|uniref:asparagine synthase (glutamine-hydrolyzing) n=1 Tax=Planotetraspora kaengkrachanensis TaxID=575193 RepID=A0A8J3LXF8_9ACTN|nr:asparagine synthetase B [Planotetraspora kaengkrachanensis]